VLLRKDRSYCEVYNDLSSEMVNLFRMARDRGAELRRLVELTPFAREEFELSYEPAEDSLEQARRTMVRCSMGVGSTATSARHKTGFRGSATRRGTHPGTDWAGLGANLAAVIERLQGVVIEHRLALDVIQYYDSPLALHYIDPPYVASSRTWQSGKGHYQHEMIDADHEELAEVLQGLAGAVIVSGYPSELYERLYHGWKRMEKESLTDGAAHRTEVLWMKGIDLGLFTEESARA
jgi:DNA adenine methylase